MWNDQLFNEPLKITSKILGCNPRLGHQILRFHKCPSDWSHYDCKVTEATLCNLVCRLLSFLICQYLNTASEARLNHCVSSRSFDRASVEKYLTPLAGGRPSGFNSPAFIKAGMLCAAKPKYKAASCA